MNLDQLLATLATYESRCATATGRLIRDHAAGRGYTREDLRQGERYARLIQHTQAAIKTLI